MRNIVAKRLGKAAFHIANQLKKKGIGCSNRNIHRRLKRAYSRGRLYDEINMIYPNWIGKI